MKFPHPCGEEFERRVAAGEDPLAVVPDEYVLVKGGEAPLPAVGIPFSCVVGPSLAEAACAVPHGRIRFTTVGEIRKTGGTVRWLPETS